MNSPSLVESPASFLTLFGASPQARTSAPGQINLMGEHTEANGGRALLVVTPQRASVELRPRTDQVVRVFHASHPERTLSYRLHSEERRGSWLDILMGVTATLHAAGYILQGFDTRVASDLPTGGGLGADIALTVALIRALNETFSLGLDPARIAQLARTSAVEFVGKTVVLLGPFAASFGSLDEVLCLDTRTLETSAVPLPSCAEFIAIHPGILRMPTIVSDLDRTRRRECERAAATLGLDQLRDAQAGDLARVEELSDPLQRRARHVVTENARVQAALEAIEAADGQRFGALLNESHASLRDDFEASLPSYDLLVELAQNNPLVYGARFAGIGLSGAVLMLVRPGHATTVSRQLAQLYQERMGHTPQVLIPPPAFPAYGLPESTT